MPSLSEWFDGSVVIKMHPYLNRSLPDPQNPSLPHLVLAVSVECNWDLGPNPHWQRGHCLAVPLEDFHLVGSPLGDSNHIQPN